MSDCGGLFQTETETGLGVVSVGGQAPNGLQRQTRSNNGSSTEQHRTPRERGQNCRQSTAALSRRYAGVEFTKGGRRGRKLPVSSRLSCSVWNGGNAPVSAFHHSDGDDTAPGDV